MVNSPYLYATENEPQQDWIDNFLTQLGSSDTIDVSQGIDWGVLPGPFANPEQGVGFGIAAVGLYAPSDWVETTPYSTLAIKSYISSTGSYGLGLENRTYLNHDRLRLLGDVWISHSPQYYWGVGKKAAEDDRNKSEYQGRIFKVAPKVSYQFLPHTYVTLGWDFQSYAKQKIDSNLLTAYQLEDQRSSGISTAFEYDRRDFEPNPYHGILLFAEWVNFRKSLGSDQNYQRLTINYRQYVEISDSDVLAWDLYGQKVDGDIPWYGYAEMGNDDRMRGYYTGQYRDRYQLSSQIELRHRFNYRHGMVAWISGGNIAPKSSELFSDSWLPSAGIGYRFTFKPRINVRIDYAVGKDSSGFYFNINEAF
ncbi:TPA: BamA/TamA family outer membrane protein [Photobacterium damselae]